MSWQPWFRSSTHQQPLLYLATAAILGVLLDSFFETVANVRGTEVRGGIWIGLIVFDLFLIAWHSVRPSSGGLTSNLIRMFVLILASGGLNHLWQTSRYENASILSIIDQESRPAVLGGVVDQAPVLRPHPLADQRRRGDQSPWQTRLTLSLTEARVGRDIRPIDGCVTVSVDGRRDQLRPGDPVRVYGNLRGIGPATNPGQTDFFDFYRRQRIHGRVDVDHPEQVELLGPPRPGYQISRWISMIARRGRDSLMDQLGDSTGPLAVALVIGQRDFVDNNTRDQLLVTGTAHLLSVSGMHLAIVVAMTAWMAMVLRLPTAAKIGMILIVCIFYCAITGARPPVMRAAVLVSTLMFAIWMRRPGQAINSLSLAALFLVILNPESVFSVGVHLSFVAVATLVLASRSSRTGSAAVDEAIRQEEQLAELAESSRSKPIIAMRYGGGIVLKLFWFSTCVAVTTMPLVWHEFNVISWISIPTNVVLGPLLFVSLASGIATVAATILIPPIAWLPAYVCDASLVAMRSIIALASSVPCGHTWLPAPPTWWVAGFYVVLVASLALPRGGKSQLIRGGSIALWLLISLLMATAPGDRPKRTLEATFIDVGHGTSVILRTDSDQTWLYDCGRLGNDTGSSRDIAEALWELGVTRIDGVFLSHADADHFNALPGVLRRFRVDRIYTPPGMLDEPEIALRPIRQAIESANVPVVELCRGDAVTAGSTTLKILHPPLRRLVASDNANSMVMQIDHGGKSFLLPGDLEPPGTGMLIRSDRPPPGGVLMAPHHGSLQMDAETVLRWARPAHTIVSGGQRADRVEVVDLLSSSGSRVYITARDGAIRVRINDRGIVTVDGWLTSPW